MSIREITHSLPTWSTDQNNRTLWQSEGHPTREDIFEVLSNERRRCVIHYLSHHADRSVSLSEVVNYVTAWQNEKPIDQITSKERMCVYSALHQNHLPKLAALNLIEYDQQRGYMQIRDESKYARLYLEYDPENDIPWNWYYLGVAGIGLTLLALHVGNWYPFAALSGTLVAGMIVSLIAISALFHSYHDRKHRIAARELYDTKRME